MAIITIKRTSEFLNRARDYQIYVDKNKIGSISNGDIKDFSVPSGQHKIVAKIDWCSSQEISFHADDNQTKVFKVSGFKSGNWLIFLGLGLSMLGFILNRLFNSELSILISLPVFGILIYYITVGRKEYLLLTEQE